MQRPSTCEGDHCDAWPVVSTGHKNSQCETSYSMYVTGMWYGNLRERDYLEDPGIDRRKIKMDLHKWDRGTDWIDLAQDMGRWRAVVNAVMNHRVP